jgi:hypothetical protein
MWLVISEPSDESGIWAYQKLSERGLGPIDLIAPEELSYLRSCEYEITSDYSNFEFVLFNGKTIKSEDIQGILNRFYYVHTMHFAYSKDAGYATEEMNAFFIGWLGSLEVPVLNKPLPYNFHGRYRHVSSWRYLAAKAGLNTIKYSSSDLAVNQQYDPNLGHYCANGFITSAIVVDDEVIEINSEDLSSEIKEGCIKLGHLSETRLLQLYFARAGQDLVFSYASPFPQLVLGGNRIIDKIKDALEEEER